MPFEENEISINSVGGTELCKRLIASRLPAELTDNFQVICSRVREIEADKIRVYWLHDLPWDTETNHLKNPSSRDRFHKLVFCGNWQYNQYLGVLGIPADNKCITIETPIVPIEAPPRLFTPDSEIRLIYTSTPQRGLSILVPVFQALAEKYPNIHLDVFSSFKIYGWENSDKQFEGLFETCKNHPKITYHGHQPNEVVREALSKAHIFAYPSIWQECNSRSLIEAMSAGLMCVHPNLAGLADTSGNLTSMYQFSNDHNVHANIFYQVLEHAIKNIQSESAQNYMQFVKTYADTRFNADKIVSTWKAMMEDLHVQYPTANSRGLPSAMFRYST